MKLAALSLLLFCLCACSVQRPEQNRLRQDLIGRTMGGREKTWKFEDPKQVISLNIIGHSNNVTSFSHIPKLGSLEFDRCRRDYYVLEMELHDLKVKPSFYSQALLTYKQGRLVTVGLLYIEQLDPVR